MIAEGPRPIPHHTRRMANGVLGYGILLREDGLDCREVDSYFRRLERRLRP